MTTVENHTGVVSGLAFSDSTFLFGVVTVLGHQKRAVADLINMIRFIEEEHSVVAIYSQADKSRTCLTRRRRYRLLVAGWAGHWSRQNCRSWTHPRSRPTLLLGQAWELSSRSLWIWDKRMLSSRLCCDWSKVLFIFYALDAHHLYLECELFQKLFKTYYLRAFKSLNYYLSWHECFSMLISALMQGVFNEVSPGTSIWTPL